MSQRNKVFIGLIALIVIGVAAYVIYRGNESDTNTQQTNTVVQAMPSGNALERPNPLGEITIGAANAPVTIVEYSSLTCGFCGAFHANTLPELKKKYVDKGLVRFLFRPFPLDSFATAGAMVSYCLAPSQRVAFLDILFARQASWTRSRQPSQNLQRLARQAGLSESGFAACLENETILSAIRDIQRDAAVELGVRSTPTFFINGRKLEGNQPVSEFDKRIKPFLPDNIDGR